MTPGGAGVADNTEDTQYFPSPQIEEKPPIDTTCAPPNCYVLPGFTDEPVDEEEQAPEQPTDPLGTTETTPADEEPSTDPIQAPPTTTT